MLYRSLLTVLVALWGTLGSSARGQCPLFWSPPTYMRWSGWVNGTGVEIAFQVQDMFGNPYLMPNGAVTTYPYDPLTQILCPANPTLAATPLNFFAGPVNCFNGTQWRVYTAPLGAAILNSLPAQGGGFQVTPTYANVIPNPVPGPWVGGTFYVISPAPMLASISPSSAVRGVTTALTIHGGLIGHEAVSDCGWNSAQVPWGYGVGGWFTSISNNATISSPGTQVTFNLTPHALGQIPLGSHQFAFSNASSALSNPVSFNLVNPPPNATSVSPNTWEADQPPLSITVSGANLLGLWSTFESTEFSFDSQLLESFVGVQAPNSLFSPTIDVSPPWGSQAATLWTTPGTHSVTVTNPSPGGGSNTFAVTVLNPAPIVSSISQTLLVAPLPTGSVDIDVYGSRFMPTSTGSVDGINVTTTYLNGGQLSVSIPATLLTVGLHTFSVSTPQPGGGTSVSQTLSVENPSIGSLFVYNDTSYPFWMAPSTIDVQGYFFVAGTTTATIDGSSVPVSVSSSTLLTVSGTASLLGTIGTHTLVVSNPAPGGGSAQLVFQSVDPAPMIASITPTVIPTSTADTPITIVAGNSASLPTYSANGLIVEVDGVAVATTPGTATDEVVAWIPAAILGTPALRNVTLRNPVPSTVGASPAYVLPIVGPSVASVSPNLIGTIPTQTGDVTLTVTGTSFSAASSTVVADGQALTTTWVSETELSAVLPDTHPTRSQTGGAAIFVRNTPTSYSNAVGLEIDDHENLGTISTRPETIDAGTSFDLRLEGCFPSVPFILFVDVTPIPPFVPWPDATANLVLSVIPSPSTALLDGTGLFGPYIPVTFDGAGGFTLPGVTAPSPLFGVPFRLQAAYPDPFAPGGFRLTHARLGLNL